MLDRNEHLFLKLSEECDEVGQRVSKLLQFGPDEVQRDQPLNNKERLRDEIDDVLAVVHMLETRGLIESPQNLPEKFATKEAKIEKYLRLSESLGRVAHPTLPAPVGRADDYDHREMGRAFGIPWDRNRDESK